ncbi:MAG: phospho-N-acetylmuramoyl-pentapeptide-transferase [Elusimicrobiaceae bacterium]|nr:phospho-N-acetylmuramoyl-pentapeptide-transferase [Elusimicrobiaceae bacterium]
MLYYLYLLKTDFGALNVFQYLTFRIGGAVVTAFLLALLLGPRIINKLRQYKIRQIQRSDGPQTHLVKNGTPTMGGLIILGALAVTVLLWARPDSRFVWLLLWVTGLLAFVGIYDDYTKLVKRNPKGAPSWVKLVIQLAAGLSVAAYFAVEPQNPAFATALSIPYTKGIVIGLGSLYFALTMLLVVGSSNAVNLTDGLDGLAAGNMIFCAAAYAVLAYLAGNIKFSAYLKIIHVPGAGEIAVFMGALMGACLGFLWFNSHPAEVFMGDTSSLFLGGVLGVTAICVKQELLLPVIGGIFVAETLSVIMQMVYFKITKGKRLFRMAPLHHHFELKGWAETKVTVRFWIVGIMLTLTALASLKLR